LVRVGLQPNIGAGCVVRTTNKSFDFSLRRFFDSKHEFFMKKLHEVVAPEFEVDAQEAPEAPELKTLDTAESSQPVEQVAGVQTA
jgi:hypothetical protein